MFRKNREMPTIINENFRGGEGSVAVTEIVKPAELMGKGRLYSKFTIAPGNSIGIHKHEGEAEIYYILSGKGLANDNGVERTLEAGDMLFTADGESHGIKCTGDCDLVFIGVILYS